MLGQPAPVSSRSNKGEAGGVRAGALELDEEGCESRRARGSIRHAWALVAERDRGQSLKERRPQPPPSSERYLFLLQQKWPHRSPHTAPGKGRPTQALRSGGFTHFELR